MARMFSSVVWHVHARPHGCATLCTLCVPEVSSVGLEIRSDWQRGLEMHTVWAHGWQHGLEMHTDWAHGWQQLAFT